MNYRALGITSPAERIYQTLPKDGSSRVLSVKARKSIETLERHGLVDVEWFVFEDRLRGREEVRARVTRQMPRRESSRGPNPASS